MKLTLHAVLSQKKYKTLLTVGEMLVVTYSIR